MSDHLSTDDLLMIRDRASKATEGPWEVPAGGWAAISTGPDSVVHAYCKTEDCECGGDAEVSISLEDEVFIANARQDVPALLAHIDGQAATIRRVHGVVDWIRDTYGDPISRDIEDRILIALYGGQS